MPNRLEPKNLLNFTGGLNLRRNQFQLAENESPNMLNVEVLPSGGIVSRLGWQRWAQADIVAGTWNPRSGYTQMLDTGAKWYFVANDGDLLYSDDTASFTASGLTVGATPHLADYATWGNTLYIAAGQTNQTIKRVGTSGPAVVGLPGWNDTYTNPLGGTFPSCDYVQAHGGYMFAAGIDQSGAGFPNRVRWSHPNNVEDWATDDYIDISIGGSKITGLMSFSDHLLIFKTNSVWALYGYDAASWQLIQISSVVGAPHNQAIARSENAVFFYSNTASKGIFGYQGNGGPEEITEALRPAFEGINTPNEVYVGWVDQRLWVTLPWDPASGAQPEATNVFVYDPTFGSEGVNSAGLPNGMPAGAWVRHSSTGGLPGPYLGQEIDSRLACIRNGQAKNLMKVEEITSDSVDELDYSLLLGTVGGDEIITVSGDNIAVVGSDAVVFDTFYQTGWVDAGWPTRKKTWRRPEFICREFGGDYNLRIEAYRDLDESSPSRAYDLAVDGSSGGAQWGEFVWGDGTKWGKAAKGSRIVRGKNLGSGRSMQLKIHGPTVSPARWGVGAIVLKQISRRFR